MAEKRKNLLTIENFADGTAIERINDAIDEALRNVDDKNTSAKAKRKVKVELTILPDEDRRDLQCWIEIKSSLAAERPGLGMAFAHTDAQTGETYVTVEKKGDLLPGMEGAENTTRPTPTVIKAVNE